MPLYYCDSASCEIYYGIENYERVDTPTDKRIDDFIDSFLKSNHSLTAKYKSFNLLFYVYNKNSSNGVNNTLNFEKNIIEWQAEYLIARYTWEYASFKKIRYYYDNADADRTIYFSNPPQNRNW